MSHNHTLFNLNEIEKQKHFSYFCDVFNLSQLEIMKNIYHLYALIILLIFNTSICHAGSEYNLRQFSNKDGLSNISNAFKYTLDNGTITVELCTNDQNMLCIQISNSGKGILKEDIDKIFNRFQILDNFESQGDQSSRNGLGLAICHSMVTLPKDQVKVTNLPQQLTTFEVLLPAMDIIENTESTITYNCMHPMQNECIDTCNKEKTYTLDINKGTFYKTFAQSYKMSPRQYREAKRNENTFENLKS